MTDFRAVAQQAVLVGDAQTAYRALVSAVSSDPGDGLAWYDLGCVLHDAKKWAASAAAFSRALELRPDDVRVLTNLARALHVSNRAEEAAPIIRRACEMAPAAAAGWTVRGQVNLSLADQDVDLRDAALTCARRAVECAPSEPIHRLGLAFALLQNGKWLEGFRAYEARIPLKFPEWARYPYPMWRGEETGTLLIQAEQGLGDTMMMARFVSPACIRAERVIWLVQRELLRLCEGWAPSNCEVVAMPSPLPAADAWCPMFSLPVALETDDVVYYRRSFRSPRRIGITWRGNHEHDNTGHRDIPIREFFRLAEIPGVTLHSLQMGGDVTAELNDAGGHGIIEDLAPKIRDMQDTAELVAGLDLVISCDTAVVHLCGVIGKPCWVLVNQRCVDWRWGFDDEVAPWYPSVRVMRRGRKEEWRDLMGRVAGELANG